MNKEKMLQAILIYLQDWLNNDPESVKTFYDAKVKVNDKILNHPHILLSNDEKLSFLGLLNGFLAQQGIKERIAIRFNAETEIDNFIILKDYE